MTTREFEEGLLNILNEAEDPIGEQESEPDISNVRTFSELGVMTYNRGLVVRMNNGDEFQVTIVQSRKGELDEREDDEE